MEQGVAGSNPAAGSLIASIRPLQSTSVEFEKPRAFPSDILIGLASSNTPHVHCQAAQMRSGKGTPLSFSRVGRISYENA